ncbi:MAG: CoA-binding protein [Deltaproteobacteria bacterium]|nr:CoA-binding protein [Deltaproteobacteria bacterium]MBW2025947.1 CoA-binding protein [Deltaproteobacteria bacterium]MBW2126329.1 CoA-binding protein [Deltaproteobacteria bacterium]RLB12055.1 MAG: hypothetical protein DRG63_12220 [Deltaproteobacteria bacterium]
MDKYLQNMKFLFNPSSVAVVGASQNPGKLGFHVMKSLTNGGFPGKIFPINPGGQEIMGISCYPTLAACGDMVDLAIVVVPASVVPTVFQECVKNRVKGIVLITAGFKEIEDPQGAVLHEQLAAIADRAQIPVIGPNTFGMINFHARLNASFTPEFSLLKKGHIALVSQSGGMSHLLGFLGIRDNAGFSKIVGLGNRLNVDFAQMIEYLCEDSQTKAIALYVEGIDDPGSLVEKAKAVTGRKPIVAYKTGSAHVGDQASLSHTGSVAGKHDIYLAAFRQAGIVTVPDSQQLLDVAKAFAYCPIPRGKGIAVLSGQAGPGMAGSDICEREGLEIVSFTPQTQAKINSLLPPLALRTNPVDMGPAWYDASAIAGIVKAVMDDDNVGGILLFMMFASANVDAVSGMADLLKSWNQRKPVISCMLSPPGIWDEQVCELEECGAIVNYSTPERAARAMAALCKWAKMTRKNKG